MGLRGARGAHGSPRRGSAGIGENGGGYGWQRTSGEYLRGKSIKITTNSIAHFFSSAIDNYIFFIRITFWIYGVNSLEGFLAVAETFVIFIFFHPKAS